MHLTPHSKMARNLLWIAQKNKVMRSFRVLVIEDSASDLRLFREALKETGLAIHIAVAHDGMEATEYLRGVESGVMIRPDLILLDWNLPRKNGKEVLAEVKASASLKQIPILVMTSSRAEEDIADAYRLNANGYVAKPNDLPEYLNVVKGIEDFWFRTAILPSRAYGTATPVGLAS
jgi:chemotaxis family two-component system response regulator Rcp1